MIDYSICHDRLRVGTSKIVFSYPIHKIQELDDRLIVVLAAFTPDSHDIDNIYAVSEQGHILWRIQSRDMLKESHTQSPYVGVSVHGKLIRVIDFFGARYFVDPQNGNIIGRDRNGRDW